MFAMLPLYNKFKDPSFVGMTGFSCNQAKQKLRSAFTTKLNAERSICLAFFRSTFFIPTKA